jgi:hypothetical protein
MTTETHGADPREHTSDWLWYAGVAIAAGVWWLVYGQLIPCSEWATGLFPVDRHGHAGEAIAFFIYDVPKVLLLLTGKLVQTGGLPDAAKLEGWLAS